MIKACLTIGGSDSCAGAGIQADLATLNAFGIKGCSAITALTAQTPDSISRIETVSLDQLEAEVRSAFSYYDIRVVKTGMLVDAERIRLIASLLDELHENKPLIVDPVLVSTSGRQLLDVKATESLKAELFPLASLITPNIPEALALSGAAVSEATESIASQLSRLVPAVLIKGGHGAGEQLSDLLYIQGQSIAYEHGKKEWAQEQSHGTGCRLASAIAAGICQGEALPQAVKKAVEWLQTT